MGIWIYTLLFLFFGILLVSAFTQKKKVTEKIWLGIAFGILLEMWIPAIFAYFFDFTMKAHIAALLFMLAVTIPVSIRFKDRILEKDAEMETRKWIAALLVLGIPFLICSIWLQYTHMLMPAEDGSYWCGQSTYGDLCMHLSFMTSIKNASFPPDYNLLYGTKLSYPYLVDSLGATFLLFGSSIQMAVAVPGTLLMELTFVGYMMLCKKVLKEKNRAIVVATLLFFLNGGLGFIYDFDMAFRDQFMKIREIFEGFYKTPANQPDFNLRFSNVIADLMVPQRSLLAGWALVLPVFYLLLDAYEHHSLKETVFLAVWAGALPLVHTHTFLALGIFSGGYIIGRLIVDPENRKDILLRSLIYLLIVLAMAAPQLLGGAIRQTVEGGSLRIQFNWVNNSGGRGFIDEYFWFWIKNAGIAFLLVICGILACRKRGRLDIVLGMMSIYAVAEIILFQPNEYDNNKLFYIWYMFAMIIAADYLEMMLVRLQGLPGRNLLFVIFMAVSVCSGSLSLARECISSYQLFSKSAVEAGNWIEENTEKTDVFMTGQQHINPVCSLAGRQIICGSNLYVFFHGLNYRAQEWDCREFYEDPLNHLDTLQKYNVRYIYLSDYEKAEMEVDEEALSESFDVVFQNRDVKIFEVSAQ